MLLDLSVRLCYYFIQCCLLISFDLLILHAERSVLLRSRCGALGVFEAHEVILSSKHRATGLQGAFDLVWGDGVFEADFELSERIMRALIIYLKSAPRSKHRNVDRPLLMLLQSLVSLAHLLMRMRQENDLEVATVEVAAEVQAPSRLSGSTSQLLPIMLAAARATIMHLFSARAPSSTVVDHDLLDTQHGPMVSALDNGGYYWHDVT